MDKFYKFKNGKLLDITSIVSIDIFKELGKIGDKYEKQYYISITYINYGITLSDSYYGNVTTRDGLLWSRLNHNNLDDSLESKKSLKYGGKTINKIEVITNTINLMFINEDELRTELIKLEEYIKIYYNEL